jgi:hypothetical protein
MVEGKHPNLRAIALEVSSHARQTCHGLLFQAQVLAGVERTTDSPRRVLNLDCARGIGSASKVHPLMRQVLDSGSLQ